MVSCHSLAQRGNEPHNQCISLSRIDNRGSCLDNMPTFKPKHLLHSCPAGEATISDNRVSHSNTLTTLHWQLALEEKWPGTSIVQNPHTAMATSGGGLDRNLLGGSLALVLAVVYETWMTETRTKASAGNAFFPWFALKCSCLREKKMIKTKQT